MHLILLQPAATIHLFASTALIEHYLSISAIGGSSRRSVPSNNQVLLTALVAAPLADTLQCGVRNGLVNAQDISVLYKWLVGNRADCTQGVAKLQTIIVLIY